MSHIPPRWCRDARLSSTSCSSMRCMAKWSRTRPSSSSLLALEALPWMSYILAYLRRLCTCATRGHVAVAVTVLQCGALSLMVTPDTTAIWQPVGARAHQPPSACRNSPGYLEFGNVHTIAEPVAPVHLYAARHQLSAKSLLPPESPQTRRHPPGAHNSRRHSPTGPFGCRDEQEFREVPWQTSSGMSLQTGLMRVNTSHKGNRAGCGCVVVEWHQQSAPADLIRTAARQFRACQLSCACDFKCKWQVRFFSRVGKSPSPSTLLPTESRAPSTQVPNVVPRCRYHGPTLHQHLRHRTVYKSPPAHR